MQEQRQKGGRVGCDQFPYPAVAILFARPSSLVLSSGDFILHAIPKLRHTTTSCSVGLLVLFFSAVSATLFFLSCSKGIQPWRPYLCALGPLIWPVVAKLYLLPKREPFGRFPLSHLALPLKESLPHRKVFLVMFSILKNSFVKMAYSRHFFSPLVVRNASLSENVLTTLPSRSIKVPIALVMPD